MMISSDEVSKNPRLKLEDSFIEILEKMSEGNPGALTVLAAIRQVAMKTDPRNILGWMGYVLLLDSLGLYGSGIWVLYKDICQEQVVGVLSVLRGWQLGLIGAKEIREAVRTSLLSGDTRTEIDVPALREKIRERLPDFDSALEVRRGAAPRADLAKGQLECGRDDRHGSI